MANVANTTELTNYERWQIEKYGNVLPPTQKTLFTNSFNHEFDEMHRLEEWTRMQEERQLAEKEEGL